MVWHRNPSVLWSVIALLALALLSQNLFPPSAPRGPEPAIETGEAASRPCVRAAKAAEFMARAAGSALYVATDVRVLVHDAIAAQGDRKATRDVLRRLRAVTDALRIARRYSERGDPPAWKRFQRWQPRCLPGRSVF